MGGRSGVCVDHLIAKVDDVLRTVFPGATWSPRPSPAASLPEITLAPRERRHAAGLMRVNHAGEVCAQALYAGQALVARSATLRADLRLAATEESDHLRWCRERLDELGSRHSRLDPLWFAGSLVIGMTAAVAGDRWSRAFIEATETKVVRHLDRHLARLPARDARSRAIVAAMRDDEARHAALGAVAGGARLPWALHVLMAAEARLMTSVAYWI